MCLLAPALSGVHSSIHVRLCMGLKFWRTASGSGMNVTDGIAMETHAMVLVVWNFDIIHALYAAATIYCLIYQSLYSLTSDTFVWKYCLFWSECMYVFG